MNFECKDFDTTNLEGWLKCGRDDLNRIPMMVANGYTVEFDYNDIRAKRITPENVPHNCVAFSKGNLHTWKGYKNEYVPDSRFRLLWGYWITAILVDKHYTNHIHLPYLSMVIKYEKTMVTV
jgi:hypothetical protein